MDLDRHGHLDMTEQVERCGRLGVSRASLAFFLNEVYGYPISEMQIGRIFSGRAGANLKELRLIDECLDDICEINRRANGAPLNYQKARDIVDQLRTVREQRLNPPPPPDAADWGIFSALSTGEKPGQIASRLSIPTDEVERRLLDAVRKIDFVMSSVRRGVVEAEK